MGLEKRRKGKVLSLSTPVLCAVMGKHTENDLFLGARSGAEGRGWTPESARFLLQWWGPVRGVAGAAPAPD